MIPPRPGAEWCVVARHPHEANRRGNVVKSHVTESEAQSYANWLRSLEGMKDYNIWVMKHGDY